MIISSTGKTRVAIHEGQRIARLLRIQQPGRFSRYPIAPFVARMRIRRTAENAIAAWQEHTATVTAPFSKAVARSVPHRHASVQGHPKLPSLPTASNRAVRRSLPGLPQAGNAPPGHSGWPSKRSAVSVSATEQEPHRSDSVASRILRSSIRTRAATGHSAPRSGNTSFSTDSFAPMAVLRDEAATQPINRARQRIWESIASEPVIGNAAGQAGTMTVSGLTEASSEASVRPASKWPDQVNAKSGARSGVIHIDSTSLGRWTVEHLARILSRQPTGMTGIDPRISAPRSRLSPF